MGLCGSSRRIVAAVFACASLLWARAPVRADGVEGGQAVLEVHYMPTDRAQLALWLERADGEFVRTIRLTEATALRGMGNRPGASQMNSGFRWPYGRREGALPVWAAHRASAPDAQLFRRVIFQDRRTEGLASRTSNDQSTDDYYCLSFDRTRSEQSALDAVSCATVFNSDKGRFLTERDLENGYAEPYESSPGQGHMEPLPLHSLYPPRHDMRLCEDCNNHPDVALYDSHVREVMPHIDAVTMATPVGGVEQAVLYPMPADLPEGDYRLCAEVNTEGDHNASFAETDYPTPQTPEGMWDSWAMGYGYPYRGQPSVVYCVDFAYPGAGEQVVGTDAAAGSAGNWDTFGAEYGALEGMAGIDDDPDAAPGSGADRLLRMDDGARLRVEFRPQLMCGQDAPPGEIGDLRLSKHPAALHAHEWAILRFAAAEDDIGVFQYDVRVSTEPIIDDASFMRATPAKQATVGAEALQVPADVAGGAPIEVQLGGLIAETHYYVGIRAIDGCASAGGLVVAEYTTPARSFTTVSPCFVATAAFGDPMAEQIWVLRRFRDRYLMTHPVGRWLVARYYEYGPAAAQVIAQDEDLRAAVRWILSPLIAAAELLED